MAIALVGSGCSSTLTDAATITYKTRGARPTTVAVTRDDLLSEVGKIVANKPFADVVEARTSSRSTPTSPPTAELTRDLAVAAHPPGGDRRSSCAVGTPAGVVGRQGPGGQGRGAASSRAPTSTRRSTRSSRPTLADRQARTEALLCVVHRHRPTPPGEKYFDAHKAEFACASGRNVSHILVSDAGRGAGHPRPAQGAARRSRSSRSTKSTDTASGSAGRALGCLAAGAFVPVFQTAADEAPFDTPIGPVKSQFGYHIILVTHADPSYADVAAQRCSRRSRSRAQPAAQTAIDVLLKSFKVHLDPRFGTWGCTPNGQGQTVYEVTPPSDADAEHGARGHHDRRRPPARARRPNAVVSTVHAVEAARRGGRARPGRRRSPAARGPRRARAGAGRASCAPRAIPRSTTSPRDGIDLEPLDLLYDRRRRPRHGVRGDRRSRGRDRARARRDRLRRARQPDHRRTQRRARTRARGSTSSSSPASRSSTSRGGGSASTRCTARAWSTGARSRSTPRARPVRC